MTIEDLDAVDDHISSPEGGEHRARATKIRRGATIVTWLAIAYVWVGTPRWLTVEPPPVPTVEEESNALRLNVAVVMGTLVSIALPNFHEVLVKARAAEAYGDFETVRLAVLNYHAEHLQ